MTHLNELLRATGYAHRAPQTRLYEALIAEHPGGLVAQAGTGVGKSIAILAAAAHAYQRSGTPSLIVTPTRLLMDQYMAKDAPLAGEVFGLDVAELRGRAHYQCEKTAGYLEVTQGRGFEYTGGCMGEDSGCTTSDWGSGGGFAPAWECGYQEAKQAAREAQIVVTNTDFWLINDRLLAPNDAEIFPVGGSLFVDEAHALDAKMREYASRSMSATRLRHFGPAKAAGNVLADWIEKQGEGRILSESPNFPVPALLAVAGATLPEKQGRATRETHDAARSIVARMREPIDACVMHVSEGAIRMDWTSVATAAGGTLRQRPFALVSATVPLSMPRVLGVPDATYVNVGHPFSEAYAQSTLQISKVAGDFKSRGSENFQARIGDVLDAIDNNDRGSLILVNSRRDCEFLADYLGRKVRGREVRAQTDEQWTNEELTQWFKRDGNQVLIGMESYKTGFDAPGRVGLVVLWSMPYPAVGNPVWKKIAETDFNRYNDAMKVSAVQGLGRAIRTVSDRAHILIADSRGSRLVEGKEPLTEHLLEFRRV